LVRISAVVRTNSMLIFLYTLVKYTLLPIVWVGEHCVLSPVDHFPLNLQANNYSPETVYNYERDLQVFDHFITESTIGFDKVNKRTITYYKAYLGSRDRKTANLSNHGEKPLDSQTINRMLAALKGLFRLLK